MELLGHYLKAVKMYLPREQKEDIIKELSENLLSKMEEKEAELGRSLSESEQEAILLEHGNPRLVADRYGPNHRCVAFGRQLIGPELYPLYIRILWVHWVVTIIIHASLAIFSESPGIGPFLFAICGQLVGVTVVFMVIEFFQRKQSKSGQHWNFPPEYLQLIPSWLSASGLAVLAIFSLWWAAVPYFPRLIFGTAVGELELAQSWHSFYWPILLLLLVSMAHRVINLFCPQWNWLRPATRLAVNVICLSMLYFLLDAYPYVLVADTAADLPAMDRLAHNINEFILGSLLFGFSFYWLIMGILNGWFCVRYIKYLQRRRQQPA